MVVFHYDAHAHEHLLDKRVMHMHMHIPKYLKHAVCMHKNCQGIDRTNKLLGES